MYLIDFEGEAVIHADDKEDAIEQLEEELNSYGRQITINNIKELD